MSDSPNNFVWHELMTTDREAAAAFYRDVVGWRTQDSGLPGLHYTILSVGETGVGGIMTLPAESAGAQPGWIGYVGVADVDSYAKRVEAAGGTIHKPPADIPGVGRFAVVADPQGTSFVLFKGASQQPPERPTPDVLGMPSWNELHAGEWQSAFAFYADLFGWTKADTFDMGPAGTYQLFAAGGAPIGGMMTKFEGVPAPSWLHYFTVDAIDAAATRARDKGGQVLQGPHEVPGGSWIIQCRDPQGAMFALVASRR
jgi:predicted enzyme related to lactoylglutathione lyase